MTEPPKPADQPDSTSPSAGPPDAVPPPYPGPPGYPPPSYPPGVYPGSYPPPPGSGYPGYPPAPPAPYSGYGAPVPTAPRNGLGIAALIAGILSLPAAFTIFGGFILALVAIILGIVGYRRSRTGESTNGGMAIGGVGLGVLGIVLSAVLIAIGIWGFNTFGGRDYFDCMRQAGNDRAAQLQCEDDFKGNLENRLSITLTPTP